MQIITILVAGRSNGTPGPAEVEVQILNEKGKLIKEISESIGNATDNFAEYQAVMRGLQISQELFAEKTKEFEFEIKLSNELVKKQLNNELPIKEIGLIPHFIEIHNLQVTNFSNLKFTFVSLK